MMAGGADSGEPQERRPPRAIEREAATIRAMVVIFCHDLHGTEDGLCADCTTLLRYAEERLVRCPFGEEKPTCANCPVHCYKADMRERVRAVMRYSGPKMALRHPVLSALHLLDGRKKPPVRKPGAKP
jgi:hypothetical protein